MSEYIKGSEIIEIFNILEIDLLNAVQKGLQPLNQNGLPIPPPEISSKKAELDKRKKDLKELQQELLSIIKKPYSGCLTKKESAKARAIYAIDVGAINKPRILDNEKAIQNIENMIAPFKNNEWGLFQFKTDKQTLEAFQILKASLFKKEDVERLWLVEEKQPAERPANIAGSPDYSDFIKETKISRESDIEIKIIAPNQASLTCDFKKLGFRGDRDKGWKALIDVLEIGSFSVGKFNKKGINNEYGRLQKRLLFINDKLVAFFKQQYDITIPDKLIFFKLWPGDQPGVYRPTFQIIQNEIEEFTAKCSNFSKEEFITIGRKLMTQSKKVADGSIEAQQIKAKLQIIDNIAKMSDNYQFIMSAISESKLSDLKDVYESDRNRENSVDIYE